jgi:hypothetical protein
MIASARGQPKAAPSSEIVSVVVMGSGQGVEVAGKGVAVKSGAADGKGRLVGVSVAGTGVAEGKGVGVEVAEGAGVEDGGMVGVGETVGDKVGVRVGKRLTRTVGDGITAETVPPGLVSLSEIKVNEM